LRQAIMQPLLAHNAALAGPSGMRSLAVAVHDLDAGGPRDAGATLGQGAGGGTATGAGFGVVAGKAGPVPGDARSALPPAAGGLWGVTHHGWLYVQMLLVPEAARGTGLGTRLMRAAEAMAVQRGCHAAWVDTQFGARGFYERLGYAVFGELRDFPPGFTRSFLHRRLVDGPAPASLPPPAAKRG
jgi:GNAT superfamily N-acetyltransferase